MRGILGLIAVVIPIVGSAQTEEWVARYDGPDNSSDGAYAITVDGSGNVYVTGYSWGSGTGYDYATVKYNASGAEQWVARYNGPGNDWDRAYVIAVDGSGNVYVTGVSEGSGLFSDYATVKYNASGTQQWVARYNGPGNGDDWAWAIAVDGSGNVYVTGRSVGSGTSDDYATVKYNASGAEQWVTRYNGPGNDWDEASAIAVDGSGNVYVTGGSEGSGTSRDYATVKYNATGGEEWVARYNGPGNGWDRAWAIAVDGSGNVYVTGVSEGSGTSSDYATIKYSSEGIEENQIPDIKHQILKVYPNPFMGYLNIHGVKCEVAIYDLSGRLIGKTDNGIWNGRDSAGKEVQSGIYFLRAKGYQPVKVVKLK